MKITIVARGSKLSLKQCEIVIDALKSFFLDFNFEIKTIKSPGDIDQKTSLSNFNTQGIFVRNVEEALLSENADIAIHSAKDLPLKLADGTDICAVLPRGDCRDALVTLEEFEPAADDLFSVGTGSLRRIRELLSFYPLASFGDIRGNVDTRIQKLREGEFDAIMLAAAGLERLGFSKRDGLKIKRFSPDEFLPAPCQGIIAIQARKDSKVCELLKKIDDAKTHISFDTERYLLSLLDADCSMPIGVYSVADEQKITVRITSDGFNRAFGEDLLENRYKLIERLVRQL